MDETYHYDALTRRIVTETAAETRHYYFNSQWRAIEERVSGAVKAQYVWNPADRWDLIRRKRSVAGTLDEIRFVLRDYLDPAAIINESGTVTERYRYDAFGPVTVLAPDFSVRTTSECGWNFLYHAEFIDALTGLYNYGYRYYHADLGRWISRDPIGERGGLKLYGFVRNICVFNRDLLGKEPCLLSELGMKKALSAEVVVSTEKTPNGKSIIFDLISMAITEKYIDAETNFLTTSMLPSGTARVVCGVCKCTRNQLTVAGITIWKAKYEWVENGRHELPVRSKDSSIARGGHEVESEGKYLDANDLIKDGENIITNKLLPKCK